MNERARSGWVLLALAGLTSAASAQELVVHYKLDETGGTTCFDSSSGAHHGQLVGGVVLGAPGAHSATGSCAVFDGADDHATVPDGPKLTTLTSDLTVLAWVKPATVSKRQRVMGNDGSWTFGLDGSG